VKPKINYDYLAWSRQLSFPQKTQNLIYIEIVIKGCELILQPFFIRKDKPKHYITKSAKMFLQRVIPEYRLLQLITKFPKSRELSRILEDGAITSLPKGQNESLFFCFCVCCLEAVTDA
jgi:hypothetical protein